MRVLIVIVAALCLLQSAAFAPSATFSPRLSTLVCAEAENKELVLDTNFDEVDLVRLLGLKKVKKLVRKSKRKQNEAKEE